MIDFSELEQKLAFLISQLNGFAEVEIGRGRDMQDRLNTLTLAVESYATGGNKPVLPRVNVQISGRYIERDNALNILARLSGAFPLYHPDVALIFSGSPAIFESTAQGRTTTAITCNLIAILRRS